MHSPGRNRLRENRPACQTGRLCRFPLTKDKLPERILPHRTRHEFEPGAPAVLTIPLPVEDREKRHDGRPQPANRCERLQREPRLRQRSQSPGDVNPESRPALRRDDRPDPHVLERKSCMVGSVAPLESDLELPGKPLTEGMAKEPRAKGLRVRRHVEGFVGGDPREGANHDVAHRVAARFPRGEPRLRKKGERAFDAPHLHPVDMDVLPGGQVDSSAGRVPVGRLREGSQMTGRNPSEWNADADEVTVRSSADRVDPHDDAAAAEFVRRDRSGEERLHRIRDPGDFRRGDRVRRFRIVLHMTGNPSSVAA